ncbi:MAG: DNA polymerase/3'-5' exonuclease PolX [Elusimicrobia bacterium]|nr:DNA polymerase/3'-5' exonuclease PolX [Elusimicrobiota bacterium]
MSAAPVANSEIARLFNEAAVLLELSNENIFRVRAYQKAALIIEGLTANAAELGPEKLTAIDGIGKGVAGHIAEIAKSGTFRDLEVLRKKFPRGLIEILKVQGIGAKRARLLYEKLGVDSLEKLKALALKGKIRALEGFGAKVEENILAGVQSLKAASPERMLYWPARQLALSLLERLGALGAEKAVYAGSLRRGRETVGDLDLLCAGRPDGALTAEFSKLPEAAKVLSLGPTKVSVILSAGIQCDLRVVPPEGYGAALNYFTGSKEHNIILRELALKKGLTLNEYGLFRLEDKERKRPVAAKTEQEIYSALGLKYIAPELREGRGEIELALKDKLPRLVELKDIKGDAHNHTSISDGKNSMSEMLEAAKAIGYEWIFLGDHSKSLGVVHGMDYKEYLSSKAGLLETAKRFPGLKAGRSIEMEIDKKGRLEFSDGDIKDVDLVVASVHSSMRLGEEEMTARVVAAMANPCVDAIAHPSGRLLNKREPYKINYAAVLEAARRYGTALEINGQPERQDLTDVTARMAKEAGLKLLLSSDAHSAAQLAYMEQAVIVARRAGLTKEDILNCLSFEDFCGWIRERRAGARKLP